MSNALWNALSAFYEISYPKRCHSFDVLPGRTSFVFWSWCAHALELGEQRLSLVPCPVPRKLSLLLRSENFNDKCRTFCGVQHTTESRNLT